MFFPMLSSSDLDTFEKHKILFAYAHAYLSAAELLNERIIEHKVNDGITYADADVIMFLVAHAYELALKGFLSNVNALPCERNHNLNALYELFKIENPNLADKHPNLFPVLKDDDMSEELRSYIVANKIPFPSVFHRYPPSAEDSNIKFCGGFDAVLFTNTLSKVKAFIADLETS